MTSRKSEDHKEYFSKLLPRFNNTFDLHKHFIAICYKNDKVVKFGESSFLSKEIPIKRLGRFDPFARFPEFDTISFILDTEDLVISFRHKTIISHTFIYKLYDLKT